MRYKCVVIDDEQYAVDALVNYIGDMPNLVVYQTFTNPSNALAVLSKADEIGFIFLDIEMPEISGLELAKALRQMTQFLVFTTGHQQHALAAFKLQVDDYLLKPITFPYFALKVNALLRKIELHSKRRDEKSSMEFIKVGSKGEFHRIDPAEIVYLEAAKNHVIIYTAKEQFMPMLSLKEAAKVLSADDFIRISKSFIVAKSAIKKVEGHNITLTTGLSLQLGGSYKETFAKFIAKNLW